MFIDATTKQINQTTTYLQNEYMLPNDIINIIIEYGFTPTMPHIDNNISMTLTNDIDNINYQFTRHIIKHSKFLNDNIYNVNIYDNNFECDKHMDGVEFQHNLDELIEIIDWDKKVILYILCLFYYC